MTRADVRTGAVSNLAIVGVLALLAMLLAIDLAMDVSRGTTGFHVLVEGSAIAVAAAGIALNARRMRGLAREAHGLRGRVRELTASLDSTRSDAERWRREAAAFITGLGAAIDQQLERWGLSDAEKAIALLLLKGLEHKEIAELRGVHETTVRQQARGIYRKGGLAGRHDLAAFFLEDLLGPRPDLPAAPSAPAAPSRTPQ